MDKIHFIICSGDKNALTLGSKERRFFMVKDKCQASQHSDQMVCFKCKTVWDMNDPYPPKCTGLDKPNRVKEYIYSLVDPTKHDRNTLWINAYLIWFTGAGLVFGAGLFVCWLITVILGLL